VKSPPQHLASVVVVLSLSSLAMADDAPAVPGYHHYVIGNAADVIRPTRGLLVLQGGGDDVDENYVRMGKLADGGDFVVLQASGDDEYNEYIYALCHCDSVATIVFDDRQAAFDPFVAETIRNAEALFIAGGDQSRYVRFWKGTPVEDAINQVAAKPAPIGSTSAGMAILGEYSYSAMSAESLTSEVALANPYATDVTLERDFLILAGLGGVITDQHLWERDRIGRTVVLLARLVQDGWTAQARAIAADRETSLHVDPLDGTAEVFATADHPTPYAYFMRTSRPPERCQPGQPLTIRDVEVYRLAPGGRFDLAAWQGQGGIAYTLSAEDGQLRSSRGGIY
jgi:cyanophycinase-like exopeptidase